CGSLGSLPDRRPGPEIQSRLPANSAPDLRCGTSSIVNLPRMDSSENVPPCAPADSDIPPLLPCRKRKVLPPPRPAPVVDAGQECKPECLQWGVPEERCGLSLSVRIRSA